MPLYLRTLWRYTNAVIIIIIIIIIIIYQRLRTYGVIYIVKKFIILHVNLNFFIREMVKYFVRLVLCVISEAEAARLSSVVMSADAIKAACLPLQQRNHSVSSAVCPGMTDTHKHSRPAHVCRVNSSVSNELCDSVDVVNCKCCVVKDQGSSGEKSRKRKHKIPAEVNMLGSNDSFGTVDSDDSNRCRKVKDSCTDNKCHKHKVKVKVKVNVDLYSTLS